MALITIAGVEKNFGELKVLKGVDLEIEAGEAVAIIGKSGSGKSTLLRCINALETYDKGSITVAGREVHPHMGELRALRQDVGMVFQSFNLFPHLTVGQNVMLAPTIVKKLPAAQVEQTARARLDQVGLGDKFDHYPERLSGGQQQRVAIARSLAMSPKALLCDEITSALDPELVNEVLKVMEGVAADGMTMILVTHEMRFAREVCDKLVFMHLGRVHEVGPPEQLFTQPQTPELRQFLGSVG